MEPAERKQVHVDLDTLERRIGELMQQFERTHPHHTVDSIEFSTMEVTQIQHDRAHYRRRVVVGIKPNPFNEWDT
jgi:hypothetical protein